MRAAIHIASEKPIALPINYNYILQAVVLRWLGENSYQKFIHDTGYISGSRKYKMYTFSRLQGPYAIDREKKTITFKDGASLVISSADEKFLGYLINNIILNDSFNIAGNEIAIDKIEYSENKIKSPMYIRTLSPIVIYSTFENDASKKTYYYSPYEKEFSDMLRRNLIKKYNAIYGNEPQSQDFSIVYDSKNRLKESMLVYKGTVIKGWNGNFTINGSEELLKIGYDAGIGSKNSQGFGCVEII